MRRVGLLVVLGVLAAGLPLGGSPDPALAGSRHRDERVREESRKHADARGRDHDKRRDEWHRSDGRRSWDDWRGRDERDRDHRQGRDKGQWDRDEGNRHRKGSDRDDRRREGVSEGVRERVRRAGWARVIVELRAPGDQFEPEARLGWKRILTQRKEISRISKQIMHRLARTGHRVVRRYQTVPLIALEIRADALAELEALSFYVKRITEDRLHALALADSAPLVGATDVWARGVDGTGWAVAIIDSGVDAEHPFLAGKVVAEACYSTAVPGLSRSLCPAGGREQVGPGAAPPCDLEGCWHGTHVAGIAAGNGELAGLPFSGVAKGASIVAVQVFSRFDDPLFCGGLAPCALAFTSDVIAGLEHVYLLRDQHQIAAVNLSLGGQLFSSPCDDDPQKMIIDNLRAAGIATIVASGNAGSPFELSSPACISSAVSVGSTSKADQVSFFSNVAPFLSLFAPGEEIVSSVTPGGLGVASGTSMAAPHVTGAWALLRQARPEATVDDVLAALRVTGVPITDIRSGTEVTVPRIAVDRALSALLGEITISSASPASGTRGTSLDVTIAGFGFAPGAGVSFGSGVTVNAVTVVSTAELLANITIAPSAALGPRDVTVTNPDGRSATRAAGFTVLSPPPTLTLTWLGTLRDRVGQGSIALAPDGSLDGTLTVKVEPGSGARRLTKVTLQSGAGGIWDTLDSTVYWSLGVGASLDGALANDATGAVDIPVAEGDSLVLFAADLPASSQFALGTALTLTASFADGTTAVATTTVRGVPTVTALTPAQLMQGQTATVKVSGANFASGAQVTFGDGVAVSSTTFVSSSELRAAVTVASDAALGPRDVTVTNPDGSGSILRNGFSVTMLTVAYAGKLRDRVGPSTTALAPDGRPDATLTVTLVAGSGARKVTGLRLETGSGGIWDTVGGTGFWALGAATSLDGGLLNQADAAVNFTVPDGGSFVLFASDFTSGTLFGPGTVATVRVTFDDGSTVTAQTTIGSQLAVTSVSPNSGQPGASLDITIGGSGFQGGAAVSLGADVTVTSTTVVSPTEIRASIAVGPAAVAGLRDLRVTNTDGQTAVLPGAFTVTPVAPTLTLSYAGKARDRVGQLTTALAPDGAPDGVFVVRVTSASGSQTVTALELRGRDAGVWDTDGATPFWALGAAADLDTPLLNNGSAAVSFSVAQGDTFVLFASDLASSPLFTPGAVLTLTARFASGATATAAVTVTAPPTVTSVTPPQAVPGATVDVTVNGSAFQDGATLDAGAGITVSTTTFVSASQLQARLVVAPDAALGPRDVRVTNPDGLSGVLTGGFGVTPPPPALSLSHAGALRDRVGRSTGALAPDGIKDETFTMRLEPGSGDRTVTGLTLETSTGGAWDTDPATISWAVGVATTLDGALVNASNATVSAPIAEGSALVLFAADLGPGALFAPGTSVTVRARFADGTTATATTVVGDSLAVTGVAPAEGAPGSSASVTVSGARFTAGSIAAFGPGITVLSTTFNSATQLVAEVAIDPGATAGPRDVTVIRPDGQAATLPGAFTVTSFSLAFVGQPRDRVGQTTAALAPDGLPDGAFTVQFQAGTGARTVTALTLRSSAGGVWDTAPATAAWALGAADDLDSPLLNAADASVSFTVPDGGTFTVFAGDFSGWRLFTSGTSFTLEVTFSDGTTATASTLVP